MTFFDEKILNTEFGKIYNENKNNNPEYKFYFFTDIDCEKFIRENYSHRELICFQELIPGAYKADFFRLLILYKNGGIYIDMGLKLNASLNEIIKDYKMVLVEDLGLKNDHGGHGGIYNAFMASIPKDEFMKKCIDKIIQNVFTFNYGKSLWDITGPHTLGEIFKNTYNGLLHEGNINNDILILSFKKNGENITFSEKILLLGKSNMKNKDKSLSKTEKKINTVCNHYSYLYGKKIVFASLYFGSWVNSARNYYIDNEGYLCAELKTINGNYNLCKKKYEKDIFYYNNNGSFEVIKN